MRKQAHAPGAGDRRGRGGHGHDDRSGRGQHHAACQPGTADDHADQARRRDHRGEPQLRQHVRDLPAAGPPEDLEPAVRGHRHQDRRPRPELRQGRAVHRLQHQELHADPEAHRPLQDAAPAQHHVRAAGLRRPEREPARHGGSRRTWPTARSRSPGTCPTSTPTSSTAATGSASSTAPTWATRSTASTRCGSSPPCPATGCRPGWPTPQATTTAPTRPPRSSRVRCPWASTTWPRATSRSSRTWR